MSAYARSYGAIIFLSNVGRSKRLLQLRARGASAKRVVTTIREARTCRAKSRELTAQDECLWLGARQPLSIFRSR